MAIPAGAAPPWRTDDFLDWERGRPVPHELVEGAAIAMVGASLAHNLVSTNLTQALRSALRGRPCRVLQTEFELRVAAEGNVRYPDVMLDCTSLPGSALFATAPALVAEVLSPSNTLADLAGRYRDYNAVPSIHTYLVIDPSRAGVVRYTRDAAGNLTQSWFGDTLDAVLPIEAWAIAIPVAELYEDVPGLEQPLEDLAAGA